MGCGPDHWPLHAHEFGWPAGKEAHSLWVQTAVELGIPGILLFMGFFLTAIWRCWLLLQRTKNDSDAWFADSARMTIASLSGYMVAAQFVSLEALEIPYYVVLLGAGSLTVQHRMSLVTTEATTPLSVECDEADEFTSTSDPAGSCLSIVALESPVYPDFADFQSVDWRDRIEQLPQQVGDVKRPFVMN